MSKENPPLRPRDLALLLLASGDLRPRERARDQQADAAGLAIKRRLLESLATLDPEPAELEATLIRVVGEWGEPTGPTRAVAAAVVADWQAACVAPEWVAHLVAQAVNASTEGPRLGRRLPS